MAYLCHCKVVITVITPKICDTRKTFDFIINKSIILAHYNYLTTMSQKITKEEVMSAIVNDFFSDLEFIEALNNLTYGRKVQLKANLKNEKTS